MKKIIIPFLCIVFLAAGFLLGRVTATKLQTEPSPSTANISVPVTTEPESEEPEPIEAEPTVSEEEQPEPETKLVYVTSIYADVIQTEGRLVVQGSDSNSFQFRSNSQFIVPNSDETVVTLNGNPASFDDIAVGDLISIDFTGEIAESDPAQLFEVLFINIFRD